ncbi:FixH family protein [bacterium]|nr:FixH family protein [bacterium]
MMNKILCNLLILVTSSFFLFGCGQTPTQDFTQTQNGITANFSMSPASPKMMEPVALSLILTDGNGQKIEGAQVLYDLTMPSMKMPPNQPQAQDVGNGLYDAQATFTMAGDWRAEATVTYDGEKTTFAFDFSID